MINSKYKKTQSPILTFPKIKNILLESIDTAVIHFDVSIGPQHGILENLILQIQNQCLGKIEAEKRSSKEILPSLQTNISHSLDGNYQKYMKLNISGQTKSAPSLIRELMDTSLLWEYIFQETNFKVTPEQLLILAEINFRLSTVFESIFMPLSALNVAFKAITLLRQFPGFGEEVKAASRIVYLRSARALSYVINGPDGEEYILEPNILRYEAEQCYLYYKNHPTKSIQKTISATYLSSIDRIITGQLLTEYITNKKTDLNQIKQFVDSIYNLIKEAYKNLTKNFYAVDFTDFLNLSSDMVEMVNSSIMLIKMYLEVFTAKINRLDFPKEITPEEYQQLLILNDDITKSFNLAKNYLYIINHNLFKVDLELYQNKIKIWDKLKNALTQFIDEATALQPVLKKSIQVKSIPKSTATTSEKITQPLTSKSEKNVFSDEFTLDKNIAEDVPTLEKTVALLKEKLSTFEKTELEEKPYIYADELYAYAETLANYIIITVLLSSRSTIETISSLKSQEPEITVAAALTKLKNLTKEKQFDIDFFNLEALNKLATQYCSKGKLELGLAIFLLTLNVCPSNEDPALYCSILCELAENHIKLGDRYSSQADLIACFEKKQKDISLEISCMMLARKNYEASLTYIKEIKLILQNPTSDTKADTNNNRFLLDCTKVRAKPLSEINLLKLYTLNYSYEYYRKKKEDIKAWLIETGAWYIKKEKSDNYVNVTNLLEYCEKECKFIQKLIENIEKEDDIKFTNTDKTYVIIDNKSTFFKKEAEASTSVPQNADTVRKEKIF